MLKLKKGWKGKYLRVLSRHPSHQFLRRKIKTDRKVLLRMGSSTVIKNEEDYLVINSTESILNASNKLVMKKLFKENNIESPGFIEIDKGTRYEEVVNTIGSKFLAKRSFRSRAKGMILITNEKEFNSFMDKHIRNNSYNKKNPYYLERFVSHVKEYRIHVAGDNCFYSCRKMLKSDADNRWLRNNSNCVWYLESNPLFDKPESWEAIKNQCVLSLKSLKLDLGSVDIKVNKNGQAVILEVNSASSMNNKDSIVLQKYLEVIPSIIKKKLTNKINI